MNNVIFNEEIFTTIAITGFIVAFLHAAIPTHWLPFVVVGRAQLWSKAKILSITTLAAIGHVAFTTLLGVLMVWLGMIFNEQMNHLVSKLAGFIFIAFGIFYILKHFRGAGHTHYHFTNGHLHEHHHQGCNIENSIESKPKTSDWLAISSLFTLLVFSPCESFLPIFFTGIKYGWVGFALLSLVLSLGTVIGMVIFTWLTLLGIEKFKLVVFEKYEAIILGGILCILGILIIILEH